MLDNKDNKQEKETGRDMKWHAVWSGVSAIATVGILITTIAYSIFSYRQWKAMLDSNRINNAGIVEIQRASVLYTGMQVAQFAHFSNASDKQNISGSGVSIAPIWLNSGGTPTRNLHIFFGEPIESVTPIERPDMRIPSDTKWIPIVIGPKGSQNGAIRAISNEKLKQVKEGKLHIYLWGDAYYNDIFQGTPQHITQFCQEIGGITSVEPSTPNTEGTIANVILTPCAIHYCIAQSRHHERSFHAIVSTRSTRS